VKVHQVQNWNGCGAAGNHLLRGIKKKFRKCEKYQWLRRGTKYDGAVTIELQHTYWTSAFARKAAISRRSIGPRGRTKGLPFESGMHILPGEKHVENNGGIRVMDTIAP